MNKDKAYELKTIDSEAYCRMLYAAAAKLQSCEDEANNLNVFPVPDGDTGTNMRLTIDGVYDAGMPDNDFIGDYAKKSSKAMLMAARGNSGVMLSLFFRGLAKDIEGEKEIDACRFSQAIKAGAQEARSAVQDPVEGTILTVMKDCGNVEGLQGENIQDFMKKLCQEAQASLNRTPDLLTVLRKSGKVDSGAFGFLSIIQGMTEALSPEAIKEGRDYSAKRTRSKVQKKSKKPVASGNMPKADDIRFAFCTECMVQKKKAVSKAEISDLRTFLSEMGDSLVLTEDDDLVKTHVHTNDPMRVIKRVTELGELRFSKIENMRLQNEGLTRSPEPQRPYIVSCCSVADLDKTYLKMRGIEYVYFNYMLNGIPYKDDMGETISFPRFYKALSEGAYAKTSQVNVEEYVDYFTGLLATGKDVLHICMSSGLSGTYRSALMAAEQVREKFPGRKLVIVDSLCGCGGYGMLVADAADLRDEGLSIDEAEKWLIENRLGIQHWFFSGDLTHFVRGGRLTKKEGFIANLLGICPLMDVTAEGKLEQVEKVWKKERVIKQMVKKMEENAQDGLNYSGKCYINHGDCYEDALEVAKLIEKTFPKLDGYVEINYIGTAIGSHAGPGTVALFFRGKDRK